MGSAGMLDRTWVRRAVHRVGPMIDVAMTDMRVADCRLLHMVVLDARVHRPSVHTVHTALVEPIFYEY